MSVGTRSELRSQIVSDEWLTELGRKIFIEKVRQFVEKVQIYIYIERERTLQQSIEPVRKKNEE